MDIHRKADTPISSLGEALGHLPATLLGHCPNCKQGKVFKNAVSLKDVCQHCGVRFERDGGSHMISMVLNYFLSLIITGVVALVLFLRYGFFSGCDFCASRLSLRVYRAAVSPDQAALLVAAVAVRLCLSGFQSDCKTEARSEKFLNL